MAQGLELKINIRHTTTPGAQKIRTLTQFTDFTGDFVFNSLASTFSFEFYFDPRNQVHAETVCVSHLHECQIFYNGKLQLTGYILANKFKNNGKPQLVKLSGYSKAGALGDCDIPYNQYPLETNGLNFKQILSKILAPFASNGIGIKYGSGTGSINTPFITNEDGTPEKTTEEKTNENIKKTSIGSSQNIASYISELAVQRNIVVSHDEFGNVLITKPNTKGIPILNFDFTSQNPNDDSRRIPGVEVESEFNAQGLHTEITVVQQADDEKGTNASQITLTNPLIPIKSAVLFRPKTVIIDSGNQFTVGEAANYELGKEIREACKLTIKLGVVELNGQMIRENNTLTIIDPENFLYTRSTWYIESVQPTINEKETSCVLNCVLPFGYDFDRSALKNVYVDPHSNFPKNVF